MAISQSRKQQLEKRNLLSSVFVVVLIGISYQEMIGPIRESLRISGTTLGTILMFAIFFATSMRFFMGNQLHLSSDDLVNMKGQVWFFDLLVIILQTTIIIFLGGVCSVEVSRNAKIGFVDHLIALYSLDVLWIFSQWGLGLISKSWQRSFIPWAWCILNSVLIGGIIVLRLIVKDIYTDTGLILLAVLNGVAFVVDVMLVDYYDVI